MAFMLYVLSTPCFIMRLISSAVIGIAFATLPLRPLIINKHCEIYYTAARRITRGAIPDPRCITRAAIPDPPPHRPDPNQDHWRPRGPALTTSP